MIGDDDFATFFDPDEFGCTVQLIEPDRPPRDVDGMFGKPETSGGIYRAGTDPGAAQIRATPNQRHLQLPRGEVPEAWRATKVVTDGVTYSIADVAPLGRLRSLLTLTPFGDRAAAPGERGKWQVSS
ncbi:head-tail joining protein [Pseudomonas sp. RT6P73]